MAILGCLPRLKQQPYQVAAASFYLTTIDEGVAEITLSVRGCHGPQASARYLLQLVTSYINPHRSLHKTEISCIRAPLPQQPLQKRYGSPVLLHNILEDAARSYPHNIAIDKVPGSRVGLYTRREVAYEGLNGKGPSSTHEIRVVLQNLEWPACQAGQKLVAIFLHNPTDLNISMSGISKATHAFCPLQANAP